MEIAVPVAEKAVPRPGSAASSERVGDAVADTYRPRTALGKRLLALRRAYVGKGGALLDDAALEAEIKRRRGQGEA
ncbi:MAG: hypothetical protein LBE85_12715 [Candidatus Accumulibacter sp.]|nr:hypothetical protein [Accumulibacter sp.]